MSADHRLQRVVVVHGSPDPLLTYTLGAVGLSVILELGDVTIWAPDPGRGAGCEIPWAQPDYRFETTTGS